jgi:hypothetical protein
MAAIAALLVQKTGEPQGNINPRLYAIATSYPNSFHDITQGNNHIPCDLQSSGCTISGLGYQAGIGYDQATGLGSLDASNLLNAWPDFGLSSSTASLSINRGSSGAATINVSRVNGFDEPLTLSCNVAASLTNVTCSIPSAPSSSGTAVLTITAGTTAQAPLSGFPPLTWNNTSGAATVLIVLSTFVLWHQRRTTLFAGVSVSALLLTVAFTTASCGSGSASGATVSNAVAKPAPQTGSVTVTATGRQSSKSVSVTVTVQ